VSRFSSSANKTDLNYYIEFDKMINAQLQQDLAAAFKPQGIVAYSNCCRLGCTGTYEEDDPDFKINEEGGICFIRLHLNGMNYDQNPRKVYAQYDSHEYLMQHWAAEEAKLDQWAAVVGLKRNEYRITQPPNQDTAILIDILKDLELEEPQEDTDEENLMIRLEKIKPKLARRYSK
jgi:hypothetical protein